MFWGVTLESGKRYSQVVDTSYHLSMAALEPKHGGDPVMVMLEHGKAEFLLCTLDQAQARQVPLDLNFVEGEEVTFFLNGKGTVHLTGYVTDGLQDDDDDGESTSSADEEVSLPDDEEEEEEDEEEQLGMGDTVSARRPIQHKKKVKPSLLQAFNGDDSEEDSDFDVDQVEDATEDDEDEEDSDDDEEESKPAQLQQRPPLKRPAPVASGRSDSKPATEQASAGLEDSVSKKKRKKRNKKARTEGAASDSDGPKSPTVGGGPAGKGGTTLPGGVVCTDLRVGSGPVAKPGKNVHVYYTGRLANNQVFDSCRSGKAFAFRLGKREVIQGWETGIQGMKVGGKRRLVIPPGQAYGSTRMGSIPPNSTLYFDVELKAVS